MEIEAAGGPVRVVCPGCGGAEVRTVEQARGGKGALRDDLHGRLAPGPDKTGDGCMHFAEGMVLTGIGIALVFMGLQQDKPLYTIGGALLALVCFFGTFVVVRDDRREKDAAEAGNPRAERLWRPAYHCSDCSSVFCPGGTPWQGVLTPEQFKKLVWTEAGYADQLPAGDKAKDAELPADVRVPPTPA
ncbi:MULTISPECIES: hypothetical protein [Streptomyces]|uniref:Uncharacterized protein n=1 Tax=Streptomyces koelreuteriae TaxID=2838015 RepID=A0ABX8G1U8_9ACTN|nr:MULTISPECIES: hypothetical protein [Streptomyces]QWB27344.1 hypothetical protein KJK29_34705 [Streptomyces koelreuteriae]UUA10428.1 hypothetical protein NNW98_34900 [Streptomyces koelreuteriae]UUA18035.1 hypothetical protein NNW99_34785 [Streptomyces sp. CRCS-T-1]